MPLRPKQHVLEERSERAFRDSLPPEWVYRPEPHDYGIDAGVEIFAEEGEHTGLRFLVQLKSTSTEGDLRVRFSHDTADYYRQLTLPLLVVFYYAPEETVFVRWFHSLDPYHDDNLNEKSVSLKMRNEDRWGEQTTASLWSDVKHHQQAKSGVLQMPVPLSVSIEEDEVGGLSKPLLLSAVREAASEVRGLVDLHTGGEKVLAHLTVSSEETRMGVGGGQAGATLHTRGEEIEANVWGADVLMLLGLALSRVNRFEIAALLFETVAPRSSLMEDTDVLIEVLRSFTQAHMVKEALSLSKELKKRGILQGVRELLAALVSLSQEGLSRSDSAFIEQYWRRQIAESDGEDSDLAKSHYNFGNFLRSGKRNLESLKAYRRAARADPDYWSRDYFCGELAGVLFESRRYRAAAGLYERALESASDVDAIQRWSPLLADSLMQAGQYAEAYGHFVSYLEKAASPDGEWLLKAKMLEHLQSMLGIEMQKRDRKAAVGFLTSEAEASRQQFTEALRHDALCGSAWYNLGSHVQNESLSEAAKAFLSAALINRSDPEVWAYTFMLAFYAEETVEMLPYVAEVAYRFNEESFVRQVHRVVDEQPSDFPSQKVNKVFDELIQQLRQSEDQSTSVLRLYGEDGKYKSIAIRREA